MSTESKIFVTVYVILIEREREKERMKDRKKEDRKKKEKKKTEVRMETHPKITFTKIVYKNEKINKKGVSF